MSLLGGLGLPLPNNAGADAGASTTSSSSIAGTERRPSLHDERPLSPTRDSTPSSTLNEKNEKAASHNPRDRIVGDASSTDDEDEKRNNEIKQLARQVSASSTSHFEGAHVNPFHAPEGSRLDPHSPNFSARAWAKRALDFNRADPDAGLARTAGIAFKNLNVYGFGSPTDYQKNVANVWLGLVGLAKHLVGQGSKTRIDILRNFEGVVYSGELLVALGPPGSGCSTLLKTISRETSGLNVEDTAYINYQGKHIFTTPFIDSIYCLLTTIANCFLQVFLPGK